MLTRQDGILEIWDLIEATHQASVEENIAPCALTCLACSPPLSKPLLAAGLLPAIPSPRCIADTCFPP